MRLSGMRIRNAFRLWVIIAAVIAYVVAAVVSFVLITVEKRNY